MFRTIRLIISLCTIVALLLAFHNLTNVGEDDITNGSQGGITKGSQDVHLQFETVDASGDIYFSFDEEKHVFRRYDEWRVFWRSFKGEDSPVPPLSEGKEMIIVATNGLKPRIDWTIEVTAIVENEDHIEVFISDIPSYRYAQAAFTYPYEIVRTEYSEKEVIFNVTEL